MLSGTIVGKKIDYYGVEIDWSAKQDVETNKSTITSKVYITYYSINISGRTATSTIDGTSENFTTSSINHKPNTSYRRLVYTQSKEVKHNDDGTKQISISASFPFNLTSSNYEYVGTLNASETVTLDSIPRASTISSFNFTNGYINQGFDITISSKVSSYYHDIHLYIPDISGVGIDLINSSVGRKQGGTHHINFSAEQLQTLYNAMPTITSSKFTVYVRTYTSETSSIAIGDWVTASNTGNIPVTLKPSVTLSSVIASGGLNGYYIQSKTSMKLTASGSAGQGSYIVSYTFKGINITSSYNTTTTIKTSSTSYSLTTATINSDGTLKYEVMVQDARGRTASAQISIYVYTYAKPQIISASVQRCTSDGVIDSSGTYAKYIVDSTYSPININNTINNPRTVTVSYSFDGGNTYSSEIIIQSNSDTSNSISGIYNSEQFDTASSYKIKFTIKDSYGATHSLVANLSTAERIINIKPNGKGIGFGTISEENGIETPWNIKFKGSEEKGIVFNNGSTLGWKTQLYQGDASSKTVLGAWDWTNNRAIWGYENDGILHIYRPIKLHSEIDGTYSVLWTGAIQSGNITINESFRNFSFLTCILGNSSSPWGITLGAFWDTEVSELHFGAIFVDDSGYAGGNLYGAKFTVNSDTSLNLTKCGTKNGPGAYLRKIVGWR